jgi:Ca2+:H+ antiporter
VEASVWKRWINLFLLAIPVVLFHDQIGLENDTTLVLLAALTLIPLAGFVESAVEELAELINPFIGGLLHTTFTNIAELFIGLNILLNFPPGQGAEVVLGSIAGVIIRNSLLFLGVATFLGCLKNGRMRFNAERAGEYSTVFALAVIGLSLPTVAHYIAAASGGQGGGQAVIDGGGDLTLLGNIPLGSALAVVLLVSYLAYVLFAVFRVRTGEERRPGRRGREAQAAFGPALALASQPDTQALFAQERAQAEERLREEEAYLHPKAQRARQRRRQRQAQRAAQGKSPTTFFERAKPLRFVLAAIILAVGTALVFAMSETFARQAETLVGEGGPLHPWEFFFGLIVIPVIGGAVELYGAAGSARENRMEIVMATTAGATIQMILLMAPIMVLTGAFNAHPLTLIFKPIEIIVFGAVTFTFMLLSRDGESTILEGVQLVALWLLLAVTAFFLPPV